MVDASKILTVSYGTFSCTLEGFDDPFSTMRGIAEYFRDLAAEDRYFGAEPPTPDAEMLHRIAEREVQKRVEARVGDDSITLRQLDDAPAPEAPVEDIQTDAKPAMAPAPSAAPLAQPAQASSPLSKPETVAAKLARLRALTAVDEYESNGEVDIFPNSLDTFEAEPITSAFDETPEVDDQVSGIEEPSEPEAPVSIRDLVNEIQEETPEPEASPTDYAASEKVEEAEETTAEAEDDLSPNFEVDADQSDADDDNYSDVETDIDAIAEASENLDAPVDGDHGADTLETDLIDTSVEENQPIAEQDEPVAEAAADDVIASLISSDLAQGEDDAQLTDEATDEPDVAAIARVVKMRRSDFEAAQDIEPAPETDADADDMMAGIGDPIPAEASEIEIHADLSDEPGEDAEPEINDDLETEDTAEAEASAEGEEEVLTDDAVSGVETEVEAETDAETDEADEETSTLSDEDEADLMATLETVKRQEAADMRAEKEGRALLEKQDIESSADSVSRILDVTNTEMEETEGTRRRSAIAHLKAAVAATRADRLLGLGKAQSEKEEMDKYRDDLAKAVRPRRPSTTDKPKTRRQAPLVLVSEQRIDEENTPVPSDTDAVMPRRVTSDDMSIDDAGPEGENIFRDGHSFADFASEMGAKELPDLLEAAAAYSAFVEGRETFSRPQIMKAVAGLNEDQEFTREESLRSFGLLLRRGKIKKIKRGQFTIAETTRFNPEVRAVGE